MAGRYPEEDPTHDPQRADRSGTFHAPTRRHRSLGGRALARGRRSLVGLRRLARLLGPAGPPTSVDRPDSPAQPDYRPMYGPPPPAPPPPAPGGLRSCLVVVVVAVALLAIIVAGVIRIVTADRTEAHRPAPTPVPTSARLPAVLPPGLRSPAPTTGSPRPTARPTARPVVPGWTAVVNPRWGVAYDVPPTWTVAAPDQISGVSWRDPTAPFGRANVGQTGVATLGTGWCAPGSGQSAAALGYIGSKGLRGSKDPTRDAERLAKLWIFGGFTEPSSTGIVLDGRATPFTTTSGLRGSVARAHSTAVDRSRPCASYGKSTTFTFRHPHGGPEAWSFYGVQGMKGEVSDAVVRRVMSSVRVVGPPKGPSS